MQQENPFATGCRWIMRLAWINLCWGAMSVAGLLVGGLFPASVVALQMMRRYLRDQTGMPLRDVVAEWKAVWWRSNATLWPPVLLMAAVLYGVGLISRPGLSAAAVVVILSLVPFAIFAALLSMALLLELSIWQCSLAQGWRNGLLFLQQHPLVVISALAGASIALVVCLFKPILGLFFLYSPVAMVSMLGMMRIRPHLFTGVLDDER